MTPEVMHGLQGVKDTALIPANLHVSQYMYGYHNSGVVFFGGFSCLDDIIDDVLFLLR